MAQDLTSSDVPPRCCQGSARVFAPPVVRTESKASAAHHLLTILRRRYEGRDALSALSASVTHLSVLSWIWILDQQDLALHLSRARRTDVTVPCHPELRPCSNAVRALTRALHTPVQGSGGLVGSGISTKTFSAIPSFLTRSIHTSLGYGTSMCPNLLTKRCVSVSIRKDLNSLSRQRC